MSKSLRRRIGHELWVSTFLAGSGKNYGCPCFFCRALVVFQSALTVILLVGAGLFIRTVWHFSRIDPGFDRSVLLLSTNFFQSGRFELGSAAAEARAAMFYRQALVRVRQLPGIRSASWAEDLPYDQRGFMGSDISPGVESESSPNWLNIHCNVVSTGFFRTLGIPILQGRDFSESDGKGTTGAAIVNESLATRYWPGQSPIGKIIRVKESKPAVCEVVGVVKDVKYQNPWENVRPYAYFPYRQFPLFFHMDLHVSVAGDPMPATGSIRKACESADPDVTINNPRLMAQDMSSLLSRERSTAFVLTAFGLLALVLAAIGLYGIISYSVIQRAHEFGIRTALGAQRGDIFRQVILDGMVLVALGLVIGLPCSAALSRLVISRMHGLSLLDPVIYALVPFLSFAVALCAVMFPALRAAGKSIDALRVE